MAPAFFVALLLSLARPLAASPSEGAAATEIASDAMAEALAEASEEFALTQRAQTPATEQRKEISEEMVTDVATFLSQRLEGSLSKKKAPEGAVEFYMYRAQNQVNYDIQNNNAASLEGVLWYLHNEVVRLSCPRHYGISRILRLKITMKNPFEDGTRFGPFVAFDHGKCTVGGCAGIWNSIGYPVGCQNMPAANYHYGNNTFWYSLPGKCPMHTWDKKYAGCGGGGRCHSPSGTRGCTWHLENAGEINLEELSNITDYSAFCKEHGREYIPERDAGQGTSFWDGKYDLEANQRRVSKALELFRQKYPGSPDLQDHGCR